MFGILLRKRLKKIHDAEKDLNPKERRKRMLRRAGFGLAIALIAVAITIAALRYRDDGQFTIDPGIIEATPEITSTEEVDPRVASPLDGTLVMPDVANRRPLAIMIENHPEARPQFGLSLASIVYEATTEGGITRFMGVFGSQGGTKIGPVRSARPYYVTWATEYDAGYAHVGGSKLGLQEINKLGANDLDQFALGTSAYRREPKSGVALEHTMYTDTDKLWSVAANKFGSSFELPKITFKSPLGREHLPASQQITVTFSSASYNTVWNFDPETNRYLRSMAGSLHKDAITGEAISAANLIFQEVARSSTDNMSTVGNGSATIFIDGRRIEGSWKKASATAQTVFTDSTGAEIARNPGQTWISIINPGMKISVIE